MILYSANLLFLVFLYTSEHSDVQMCWCYQSVRNSNGRYTGGATGNFRVSSRPAQSYAPVTHKVAPLLVPHALRPSDRVK